MGTVIDRYISESFRPMLEELEVPSSVITKVAADVSSRLLALLSEWGNEEFRRVILYSAREEAVHYTPKGKLDIACLVVMGVRNSLLHDLHASAKSARSLGLEKIAVDDDTIRMVTADAVNFFNHIDWEADLVSLPRMEPEANPYLALKADFPFAWEVFDHLALCKSRSLPFEQLGAEDFDGGLALSNFQRESLRPEVSAEGLVMQSAISEAVPTRLFDQLLSIYTDRLGVYGVDSFKTITRNTRVLFGIIDWLVSLGVVLVTPNYLISDRLVCRRRELLRPAITAAGRKANIKAATTDLHKFHKQYLQLLQDSLVPQSDQEVAPNARVTRG